MFYVLAVPDGQPKRKDLQYDLESNKRKFSSASHLPMPASHLRRTGLSVARLVASQQSLFLGLPLCNNIIKLWRLGH